MAQPLFNKDWFNKNQSILLWLLNTPIISSWFRWVLRINGNKSSVGSRKIVRILPDAIEWKKDKYNNQIEIRTNEKFARRLYYAFKPFWYLIHYWDMFFANNYAPQLNLGFDTLAPLYPTLDGQWYRHGIDETLGTIRAGAATITQKSTAEEQYVALQSSTTSNQFNQLSRAALYFDTSPVPGVGSVVGVTLSFWPTSHTIGLGEFDYVVVAHTSASTSDFVAGDFALANFGTTAFVTANSVDLVNGQYNDLTFNDAGKAGINTTGITNLGFMMGWDFNNSFTASWSASQISRFIAYFASQTGTTNDPKLVITYSIIKKINGVYMGSQEIASTRFVDANAKIYYRFEDNVTDTTGNYNGTATDISYVTGKFGKGASFNGTSSKVVTNYATNLTTFSFSMWINLDASATGGNTILSKAGQNAANTDDFPVIIRAWDRNIYFNLAANGDYTADYSYQSGALSTGTWYHIAMVYVGASYVKTFINGVQVNSASIAWSIGTNARNWVLGAMTDNGAGEYNFDGIIDDFILTDDALTPDEIYSLYKTGVKKLNGVVNLNPELESSSLRGDANLQAYWRLENTDDETANNRDLTNTGTVVFNAGKMGNCADSGATNSTKKLTVASNCGVAGGNISINIWFNAYAATFAGDHPPLVSSLSDLTGGAGVAYGLAINGTGLIAFRLKSGVAWQETAATAIIASTWYMATMTYDGTNCKLYINGNYISQVAASGNGATGYYADQTALFCHAGYTADAFTSAKIDDCSVFNDVLSATEISNLYNTNIKKYGGVSNT